MFAIPFCKEVSLQFVVAGFQTYSGVEGAMMKPPYTYHPASVITMILPLLICLFFPLLTIKIQFYFSGAC